MIELATSNEEEFRRAPITLLWAPEIVFDQSTTLEIIEDVLLAGQMSVWYGEPGAGKTTLLIDAMLRMPHALPWLGKRLERRAAILVAAESTNSVKSRVEAYRRHHGDDIGSFGMIPHSLNLMDGSADVEELVDLVVEESCHIALAVGLIGVDTIARVMPGGDENTALDMGRLVSAGDRIRSRTEAHLAFVHHAGKDASKGARGHSSLRAATDTEIEVTYDKATKLHTLEVMKQRDLGSQGMKLTARFLPVEIGTNQWGNPITSCVVEHVETESAHIQAVMQGVENDRADAATLAGFARLCEQGVQPSDQPNSADFLPRQILSKGLAQGFGKDEIAAAMHRLMTRGKLRRAVVGQYANRSPRHGLVGA